MRLVLVRNLLFCTYNHIKQWGHSVHLFITWQGEKLNHQSSANTTCQLGVKWLFMQNVGDTLKWLKHWLKTAQQCWKRKQNPPGWDRHCLLFAQTHYQGIIIRCPLIRPLEDLRIWWRDSEQWVVWTARGSWLTHWHNRQLSAREPSEETKTKTHDEVCSIVLMWCIKTTLMATYLVSETSSLCMDLYIFHRLYLRYLFQKNWKLNWKLKNLTEKTDKTASDRN